MAKRNEQQENGGDAMSRAVRAIERLSTVIGALAVNQFGDTNLPAKSKRLRRMGFSNIEIARILASTPNAVGVALHSGKKKTNKAHGRGKKASARKPR
jgi:hypothetical protein